MCIYAFTMGAFLSLIAAIVTVIVIGKSANLLTGSLSSLTGSEEDSQSEYGGTLSRGFLDPPRQVKDIGVVPETELEDEQGNKLKKNKNGDFVPDN